MSTLCFYALGAFLPSLLGRAHNAHPGIKASPAGKKLNSGDQLDAKRLSRLKIRDRSDMTTQRLYATTVGDFWFRAQEEP